MKQTLYEQDLTDMRMMTTGVLKKMEERRELYLADRKHIRCLTDALRRQKNMAKIVELLRQEKSEAGKRFLLFILMYLFALFQKQERDKKAAAQLRNCLMGLQNEYQRGFSLAMHNSHYWAKAKKAGLNADEYAPAG